MTVEAGVLYGLFSCLACQREWPDELPPLWSGLDLMPSCPECAAESALRYPLVPLFRVFRGY